MTTLENAKRKTEFDRLMKLGAAAMSSKRFAEAKSHFTDALKLIPNEATALRALQDANQALTPPPPPKQDLKKAEFERLMKLGAAAMSGKRFAEAKLHFESALKLGPNDPDALRALQQVNQALTVPPPPKQDAKKTEFERLMKLGAAAMQGKRFAEAKVHFENALKLTPNDPDALRALQQVDQALTPPPPPKKDVKTFPLPPKKEDPKKEDVKKEDKAPPGKDIQKELVAAAKFEQQGKFAEANDSYKAALKLADAKSAVVIQKKADFTLRMAEGVGHLQGNRLPEAQKAFESALQLFPNNPIAAQLLQRAKQKN